MSDALPGADFVRRFLFDELDIRGAVTRLGPAWRQMTHGRNYPDPVQRLLGEMTAVSLLISANLKQRGRLSFQVQGHGPVSLLVIDCTQDLAFRGMASHGDLSGADTLPGMLGDGRLTLTLQADAASHPYQSVVPLVGDMIAQVFEHYLAQSEQQPARLWLFASAHTAVGLFLQRLPGAERRDADGWTRVQQLAGTVRVAELESLPVADLLLRLFPDETLRLFTPAPVRYECPENWDKVRNMLRSLGRAEVEAILSEQGEVVVHDDICNFEYRFDRQAVAHLFDDTQPAIH